MVALRGTVVLAKGQSLDCKWHKIRPSCRFSLGIPVRAHIGEEEFKSVWILPVHMRTEQLQLNHIHAISKGNAPNHMTSTVEKSNNTHDFRNSICRCLLYQELISLA